MADLDGYEYLMPTCMQRKPSRWSTNSMAYKPPGQSMYDVFEDSLKALEVDTCSEISDMSYADASYYTKMKLAGPPFLGQCFYSSVTENRTTDTDTGSQFSRSLKQFLEWPDPSVSAESEIDAAIYRFEHREGLKNRRRLVDRKKRVGKCRSSSARKFTCTIREPDSDSDHVPMSNAEESDSDNFQWKLARMQSEEVNMNTEILKHNLIRHKDSLQIPNHSKCFDSDSDYKTLSDTSSEKIEQTYVKIGENVVDLAPLKELLETVSKRAKAFTAKITGSSIIGAFVNGLKPRNSSEKV